MTHPLTAYPRDRRVPIGPSPRLRAVAWIAKAVIATIAVMLVWVQVRP